MLEKRPSAPENDGSGEHEFNPSRDQPPRMRQMASADDVGVDPRSHKRVRPEHAAHGNRQQRRRQRQADPESPGHVAQFGILFFFVCHRARLQRHAANRTVPGLGSHDLRMHRAGVLALGCGERWRLGLERHATLGTGARPGLPHVRAHRTNVGARVFLFALALFTLAMLVLTNASRSAGGWRAQRWHDHLRNTSRGAQRHQPRPHRLRRGCQSFLGIRLELGEAAGAAEKVFFAIVQRLVASGCRIHIHAADGIFGFGGGRAGVLDVRGCEVVHSFAARSLYRIRSFGDCLQLPSCARLGPFDFAQGRLARTPIPPLAPRLAELIAY